MNSPFEMHEELPELDAPVLVGMLTGWIDASNAAAAAIGVLDASCDTRTIVTFDADTFIDYRARRPTMELREGVSERLVWPRIELKVGRDSKGHDVLVLTGPEPDSAWRRFGEVVTDLAVEMGVRMAVFLGAYPFAAPHTRPPRVSISSPSSAMVESAPFLKNSVDVPAGVSAALEHALHEKDVPAIGLWAQVPHYLGAMSYPGASVALLEALAELSKVTAPTDVLRAEATIQRERVDGLVAGNDEHQAMVRQLEALHDASMNQITPDMIPSGDELAAEVERYLREHGN